MRNARQATIEARCVALVESESERLLRTTQTGRVAQALSWFFPTSPQRGVPHSLRRARFCFLRLQQRVGPENDHRITPPATMIDHAQRPTLPLFFLLTIS